jgi:hypothetical protein
MINKNRAQSNSVGFISYDPELVDINGKLHAKPLAFALIQVTGQNYSDLDVVDLASFRLDRPELLNYIFDIAESWPLYDVYCDQTPQMPTYVFLEYDRMWRDMVAKRQRTSGAIYPRLNAYSARLGSAQERQRNALAHRLRVKPGQDKAEIFFNENLKITAQGILQRIGEDAELDALAGAIEVGAILQERLQRKHLRGEQSESFNGRIIYT